MDNYWKLEKYSVHELQEKIDSNKITIPKYQRGIVWDKNKQKALIETIKKGFPFGSILVYEDKNGKQQLIDGLVLPSLIMLPRQINFSMNRILIQIAYIKLSN